MRSKITFVALILSIAFVGTSQNSHGQYVATLLHPTGFVSTEGHGISGDQVVSTGYGSATGDHAHALVWDNATSQYIDLHPTGFDQSLAFDTNGSVQVGAATNFVNGPRGTIYRNQAMLWHGSQASVVNLHPVGAFESFAFGVSEGSQVGYAAGTGFGGEHALLWRGTAESMLDLHPAGYSGSRAGGVDGDVQVGQGTLSSGIYQALLWRGTSASVVNLHPTWAEVSAAGDVSGDHQIGIAQRNGRLHAVLWNGSASSAVDLNPEGFDVSYGVGIGGDFQVGYGYGPATEGEHALVWRGTAESVFDLHHSLAGVVPDPISSFASDVDANGDIVGYARGGDNYYYAVKWTLVTEPSTLLLALVGFGLCLGKRRKRFADLSRG
jgi:hypothetical protein